MDPSMVRVFSFISLDYRDTHSTHNDDSNVYDSNSPGTSPGLPLILKAHFENIHIAKWLSHRLPYRYSSLQWRWGISAGGFATHSMCFELQHTNRVKPYYHEHVQHAQIYIGNCNFHSSAYNGMCHVFDVVFGIDNGYRQFRKFKCKLKSQIIYFRIRCYKSAVTIRCIWSSHGYEIQHLRWRLHSNLICAGHCKRQCVMDTESRIALQ